MPGWAQVDGHVSSSPAVTLPHSASPVGSAAEGYAEPMQQWDLYADHSPEAAEGCELSLRESD